MVIVPADFAPLAEGTPGAVAACRRPRADGTGERTRKPFDGCRGSRGSQRIATFPLGIDLRLVRANPVEYEVRTPALLGTRWDVRLVPWRVAPRAVRGHPRSGGPCRVGRTDNCAPSRPRNGGPARRWPTCTAVYFLRYVSANTTLRRGAAVGERLRARFGVNPRLVVIVDTANHGGRGPGSAARAIPGEERAHERKPTGGRGGDPPLRVPFPRASRSGSRAGSHRGGPVRAGGRSGDPGHVLGPRDGALQEVHREAPHPRPHLQVYGSRPAARGPRPSLWTASWSGCERGTRIAQRGPAGACRT